MLLLLLFFFFFPGAFISSVGLCFPIGGSWLRLRLRLRLDCGLFMPSEVARSLSSFTQSNYSRLASSPLHSTHTLSFYGSPIGFGAVASTNFAPNLYPPICTPFFVYFVYIYIYIYIFPLTMLSVCCLSLPLLFLHDQYDGSRWRWKSPWRLNLGNLLLGFALAIYLAWMANCWRGLCLHG